MSKNAITTQLIQYTVLCSAPSAPGRDEAMYEERSEALAFAIT